MATGSLSATVRSHFVRQFLSSQIAGGTLATSCKARSCSSVRKASDYRRHAEECRALATVMEGEARDQLLEMAGTWERLADDREQLIRQNPELAQTGETAKPRTH